MHSQLGRSSSIWKFCDDGLKSGFSSVFHGRNTVCIVCDKNDSVDTSIRGVGRNIQSDAHINPLLLKIGIEVGICGRPGWIDGRPLWLIAAEFQDSSPHGKQFLVAKSDNHLSDPTNV